MVSVSEIFVVFSIFVSSLSLLLHVVFVVGDLNYVS